MFIELLRPVDDLRLGPHAPAGMVTGVMDDLGRRLVDEGHAVELTEADFHRRLCEGHDGGINDFTIP